MNRPSSHPHVAWSGPGRKEPPGPEPVRSTPTIIAFFLLSLLPVPVASQFERGPRHREIEMVLSLEPYRVNATTVGAIRDQMEAFGPRPAWFRVHAFSQWRYGAERAERAFGGGTSQCRVADLTGVLTMTISYPRWEPEGTPDPRLVEAWDAFMAQLVALWEYRRDELVFRSRTVIRQFRRYEDHCSALQTRIQEQLDESYSDEQVMTGFNLEQPDGYQWPPPDFTDLLETPDAATTPQESAAPRAPGTPTSTPAILPSYPLEAELHDAVVAGDIVRDGSDGVVFGVVHEGQVQALDAFDATGAADSTLIDRPFAFPAFTEALIATLANRLGEVGAVALDAPIAAYLTGLAEDPLGRATLRQLLMHTAGLDDAAPIDTTAAWSTVLDGLDERALFTEPGAIYSRSRYSYGLAARVIESAIGATVTAGIETVILTPLGMQATRLEEPGREYRARGLPVAHTSVADLLRFWLVWLDGSIAGPGTLGDLPERSDGGPHRAYDGGVLVDHPGGVRRLAMMCSSVPGVGATGLAGPSGPGIGVHVLPDSRTIAVAASVDSWPGHTMTFLLGRIAEASEAGAEIFGPVEILGEGWFDQGSRPCPEPALAEGREPADVGPPAEVGDWPGRYLNGSYEFILQEREGRLVSSQGEGQAPFAVHHLEGSTYLFVPEGATNGYPVQLVRDAAGRRYLYASERAYLHTEDASGR